MTAVTAATLYGRTADSEILAVPRSISAASVAVYFGIDPERVEAVRAKADRYKKQPREIVPIGNDQGLSPAYLAEEGSLRLLRAQLETGQHDITDAKALRIVKNFAGVA